MQNLSLWNTMAFLTLVLVWRGNDGVNLFLRGSLAVFAIMNALRLLGIA